MTVERELQDWLADRARQRRTRRAIDDYARDWDRGPVHRRFDRGDRRLARADRRGGRRCGRAPCSPTTSGSRRCSTASPSSMRGDPFFEPPFRTINSDIHSGLLVFEDERVSIAAGVTRVAAARRQEEREARRDLGRLHRPGRRAQVRQAPAAPASPSGRRRRSPPISPPPRPGNAARTGERAARRRRDPHRRRPPPELCDRAGAREHRPPPGLDHARPGAAQRRI